VTRVAGGSSVKTIILIVVAVAVVATGGVLAATHLLSPSQPLIANSHGTASAETQSASQPTKSPYPQLSSAYQGTGHNITYNSTGGLTFSSIIEDQQGRISGQVTWAPPLCGSGPFTGTVSTNGSINITATKADGSTCEDITTFTGSINTQNNSMSGSYTANNEGAPVDQVGTWQVTAI
jgi:hypothetical protein